MSSDLAHLCDLWTDEHLTAAAVRRWAWGVVALLPAPTACLATVLLLGH